MRKLTPDESTVLQAIADRGGSYCPQTDVLEHPDAVGILRALVRKKRLFAVEDADLPLFRLTGAGWREVEPADA